MATIYNSELTKGLAKNAGIQQSAEAVPTKLSDTVIPTCETNPEMLRRINIIRGATSATTVYTTPTNQDFYLTSIYMVASNSTASQTSTATLTATPENEPNTTLAQLSFRTTALIDANQQNCFEDFSGSPIKIARGTNIATSITNVPSFRAVIFGYVVETANA